MGLARLGLDLWAVQLMGRWGSDAVRLYVRGAHVDMVANRTAQAAQGTSLDELVDTILARVRAARDEDSDLVQQLLVEVKELKASRSEKPEAEKQLATDELRSDLQKEALRTEESSTASGASEFVVSAGGVWHKVLHGPPEFKIEDWSSFCGWCFGTSRARAIRMPPFD